MVYYKTSISHGGLERCYENSIATQFLANFSPNRSNVREHRELELGGNEVRARFFGFVAWIESTLYKGRRRNDERTSVFYGAFTPNDRICARFIILRVKDEYSFVNLKQILNTSREERNNLCE